MAEEYPLVPVSQMGAGTQDMEQFLKEKMGDLIREFPLVSVGSENDRFGFVNRVKAGILQNDGSPTTVQISFRTPPSEVAAILSIPRSENGNIFGKQSILLQNSMQIENNGFAFVIPVGSVVRTGHVPFCPHCQVNGRVVELQCVDNRLRCPNPHCRERVLNRVLYFLYNNLGNISVNFAESIRQNPTCFASIDRLINDEDLLMNGKISGPELEGCYTIARHLTEVLYGKGMDATAYYNQALNFVMSLSIPGLTQEMVTDVISKILYGEQPTYLLQMVGENIIDVVQRRVRAETIPSFRMGAFPSWAEMEPYILELNRIEQILIKNTGKFW